MAISGIPSLNPQAIKPVYGGNVMSLFMIFIWPDDPTLAAGQFLPITMVKI